MDNLNQTIVPDYSSRGPAPIPVPKLVAPVPIPQPVPEPLQTVVKVQPVYNLPLNLVQPEVLSFYPTPRVLGSEAGNYAVNIATYAGYQNPYFVEVGSTGSSGNGSTGFTGPTGSVGPTGQQGIPGVDADTGATGNTGPAGIQGVTGPTGQQGLPGVDANTGATGPTGDQGIQGVTGPGGPAGPTGQAGSAADASQWSTFPAIQAVDFDSNDANDIDNMNANYGKIDTLDVYQSSVAGYGVLTVGSSVGLNGGTVQVYGSTNLEGGAGALSVLGGTTLDGDGYVHGVTMGTNKTLGVLLTRIDVLPIGIDMFSATFISANAVAALNTSSGGPTSIAAGSYINLESSTGEINIAGTGFGICDIVFENGGSVRQFGGLQGQADGGAAISNINSLTGYLTPAGNGMYILNVQNISGPATYGTISNMRSLELGIANPVYGPTGTYTGYTGFTGTREVTGSTGITDPSGQVIGYTGTTGIQYYEGQTGYTYQAQPIIGVSGESSSLLSSPDGTGLYWNGNLIATGTGPAGAETWASYPAIQDVSMAGYGLTNMPSITSTGRITLTSPDRVTISSGTAFPSLLDMSGGEIAYVTQIISSPETDINIISTAGINITSIDENVNINGGLGITLTDPSGVTIVGPFLDMSNSKIINLAPGTVGTDAVNYNQLTFRDSTEFWVSTQGSNTNNGSILAPFQTIQAAITAAELISSASSICNINVASGNYTENLTFNKGYVTLTGTLQSQTGNETCEITGSISIICVGADDTFNRQVTFQGFNITHGAGQSTTDTSTASHTVAFQDCKVFANSVFFNSTSSATDMRFYLTNVEVQQTNAAFGGNCITTNVGLCEFERLDLNLSANAFGIVIGGTSVLNRCSLSTFDNSNTAAILRPIMAISSSTTSTHSLGNVAFAFSSVVAKTNTSALYINSGINTAIIALNCVFTLGGTADSTNYCIGYSGVGSPTIAGVNNTSLNVNVLLPQTTTVQPGITQISYTDINPPVLASYSSSADQAVLSGGVAQQMTLNTTNFNSGTVLSGNSIFVGSQGNYAINFAGQFQNTSASVTASVFMFLKKNGTNVANSACTASVPPNTGSVAISPQIIVPMNAGDNIQVWFSAPATINANATNATVSVPASPSVIINVAQIR